MPKPSATNCENSTKIIADYEPWEKCRLRPENEGPLVYPNETVGSPTSW